MQARRKKKVKHRKRKKERPIYSLGYFVAFFVCLIVFFLLSKIIIYFLKKFKSTSNISLKVSIKNITQTKSITPITIMSLGLGVTLLLTLALVGTNFQREIAKSIPDIAPDYFFVGIQKGEKKIFEENILKMDANAKIEVVFKTVCAGSIPATLDIFAFRYVRFFSSQPPKSPKPPKRSSASRNKARAVNKAKAKAQVKAQVKAGIFIKPTNVRSQLLEKPKTKRNFLKSKKNLRDVFGFESLTKSIKLCVDGGIKNYYLNDLIITDINTHCPLFNNKH